MSKPVKSWLAVTGFNEEGEIANYLVPISGFEYRMCADSRHPEKMPLINSPEVARLRFTAVKPVSEEEVANDTLMCLIFDSLAHVTDRDEREFWAEQIEQNCDAYTPSRRRMRNRDKEQVWCLTKAA